MRPVRTSTRDSKHALTGLIFPQLERGCSAISSFMPIKTTSRFNGTKGPQLQGDAVVHLICIHPTTTQLAGQLHVPELATAWHKPRMNNQTENTTKQ